MLHETRGETSAELCRLDVIDYAGGKSEEFIRDWLTLSKNTYSSEPKAVILMLPWGPPDSADAAEFKKDIRYWSEDRAELLREAAKTVLRKDGKVFAKLFLFINKMDLAPANKLSAKALLSDYKLKTTEAEELPAQLKEIWDEVEPLVRLYQAAFRGQEAVVVFGSALHGVKVAEMLDLIR